jgi:hypothetical protein
MIQESLNIRDYEKGDESSHSEIFNKVIGEMVPNPVPITPEKVRKRHEEPDFNPKQVKYLLNSKNEIVGYTECRIHSGFHGIFYPMILKEYRSKDTLNQLFKAIFDFAKEDCKKNPGTIESHYAFDFAPAHEYFKSQSIAKIKDINEVHEMRLSVKELGYDIPIDYEIKPLTQDDFQTLLEYRKSKETIVGEDVTLERLEENFKSGEMTPEDSFLIYYQGELSGYIHHGKSSPADSGQEDTAVYGELRGMILDTEFTDGLNLRKTMLRSGKDYFDKHKAVEIVAHIDPTNPILKFYQKIGFIVNEKQGAKHYIYEQ